VRSSSSDATCCDGYKSTMETKHIGISNVEFGDLGLHIKRWWFGYFSIMFNIMLLSI
jgi:hypothetical protein